MVKFLGGPWDGSDIDLSQVIQTDEIILRVTTYFPGFPREFVYRLGEDSVYRLAEESAIIADNARLREQAKEQEAVANRFLADLQRLQERLKKKGRKNASKKPRRADPADLCPGPSRGAEGKKG